MLSNSLHYSSISLMPNPEKEILLKKGEEGQEEIKVHNSLLHK